MTNKAFSSPERLTLAKNTYFMAVRAQFSQMALFYNGQHIVQVLTRFFSEFDILNVNTFRFVSCWMRVKMLKKIKAWAALLISPKS